MRLAGRIEEVPVIHPGACHCGAIRFEFATVSPPARWSVRQCACTFCRAHGALWTSDTAGSLRILLRQPDAVACYRFGHRSADFLFCGRCGSLVIVRMDQHDGARGIINVRALDPVPDSLPAPTVVNYDGESAATRETRRRQNWTPLMPMAAST